MSLECRHNERFPEDYTTTHGWTRPGLYSGLRRRKSEDVRPPVLVVYVLDSHCHRQRQQHLCTQHAPELELAWAGLFENWWHRQPVKKYHGLSTQLGEIWKLIFLDFKVEGISCP